MGDGVAMRHGLNHLSCQRATSINTPSPQAGVGPFHFLDRAAGKLRNLLAKNGFIHWKKFSHCERISLGRKSRITYR
jgi:hypothetical protein